MLKDLPAIWLNMVLRNLKEKKLAPTRENIRQVFQNEEPSDRDIRYTKKDPNDETDDKLYTFYRVTKKERQECNRFLDSVFEEASYKPGHALEDDIEKVSEARGRDNFPTAMLREYALHMKIQRIIQEEAQKLLDQSEDEESENE